MENLIPITKSKYLDMYPVNSVIGDYTILGHYKSDTKAHYMDCVCNICGKKKEIHPYSVTAHPNTISHSSCFSYKDAFPVNSILGDFTINSHVYKDTLRTDGTSRKLLLLDCTCNICGKRKIIKPRCYIDAPGVANHTNCYTLDEIYPEHTFIGDFYIRSHKYKLRSDAISSHNDLFLDCVCTICGKEKLIQAKRNLNGEISHKYCVRKNYNGMRSGEYERFYRIWKGIVDRCTNPRTEMERRTYGNITTEYDNGLEGYMKFFDDMYESYAKHVIEYSEVDTTIDRIDNRKGYYKDNIRWATRAEQTQNRLVMQFNVFVAIDPDCNVYLSNNVTRFSNEHDLNYVCVCKCLTGKAHEHKNWNFFYIYENKIPLFVYDVTNIHGCNVINCMY